ncbi:hypothetical protein [Chitinophaga sp.]|uniref:hypothetical protein n=1 Tax=Chitinophaga sp. TaxID=1869181 RepID=UPI002F923A59
MKYRHLLVITFLLLMSAFRSFAQCSDWNISAKIDSATCAANGKITVTLTGADVSHLDSVQYRLEALTPGGTNVTQNSSNILQNLRAGDYRLTVNGLCGSSPVLKYIDVTVPGNYVDMDYNLDVSRSALGTCSNAILLIYITNGRAPFTATITSAPAAYTGPLTFALNANPFPINNLPTGDYEFSVADQCGNGLVKRKHIYSATFSRNTYYTSGINAVQGTCDELWLPNLFTNEPGYDMYFSDTSNFTLKCKINNLPITEAYHVGETKKIKLPTGVDFKSLYNKTVTTYVTSPCGDAYETTTYLSAPWFGTSFSYNCDTSANIFYQIYDRNFCGSIFLNIRDIMSNRSWTDTIVNTGSISGRIDNVPFGNYQFTATTSDGYTLDTVILPIAQDTTNPYYIQINHPYGMYGDDGAFALSIGKINSEIHPGTRIQLVSPENFSFDEYTTDNDIYGYSVGYPSGKLNARLTIGDYKFIITDECKQYTVTIHVTEDEVFKYTWNYTTQQTCDGLLVTANGFTKFRGNTLPLYLAVLGENGGVPSGSSVTLRTPGQYKIGVSAYSRGVMDFSNIGNDVNVRTIYYYQKNLDLDSSLGWVCPGAPDNSGTIRAIAAGGNLNNGIYTYKLAEEGYGSTGPYLDSNTTGNFTSNAHYSLIKNKNYDVQITDQCKAFIVRGIKILDFTNFQAITTDKPLFCVGDTVYFTAVNLPTSSRTYTWTNPQNQVFATEQTAVLYNVDSSNIGNYHVKISSDLCDRPIEGDVYVRVAPYIIKCYSAVTDTSVNPYIHGLLGNWRPSRSYTYYGPRAESDPMQETNIRKDGAFNDFLSFWQKQTKNWVPQTNNPAWVWNAESTIFNKKSFELENKDPLGRYNAAVYGYDNTVPVAVVQNSHYREAGYDGFEDYSFGGNSCSDGSCPVDRHFGFPGYINRMDTTQSHTGRYSLRVEPGDSILLSSIVSDTDKVIMAPDFRMSPNNCSVTPVLQGVRVNKDVLVPIFSPLAGKKVLFSAWVKQAQDCQCSSYSNINVTLFVGGPVRVTVSAKPKGAIIEGWQRYEEVIDVPAGSTTFSLVIATTNNTTAYFDDVRIHPYNANMKSYVYDPKNLRLMGELDENNYATFYEYDDDGTLTRVKKETERGVKTIKETRSALLKETAE